MNQPCEVCGTKRNKDRDYYAPSRQDSRAGRLGFKFERLCESCIETPEGLKWIQDQVELAKRGRA